MKNTKKFEVDANEIWKMFEVELDICTTNEDVDCISSQLKSMVDLASDVRKTEIEGVELNEAQ